MGLKHLFQKLADERLILIRLSLIFALRLIDEV